MQKKQSNITLFLLVVGIFTNISCKENLIEPEHYGEIQGIIISDDDDSAVANVSITTTPSTVATTSDNQGRFEIKEVQAGDYTIHGKKKGYLNAGVNISVRKDKVNDATVFISVDEEGEEELSANIEVTRWRNEVSNDTTHVNVDYKIENTGTGDIEDYEIYFRIETDNAEYYQEIQGADLQIGQIDVGEFNKYIHSESAKEIIVNDHWLGLKEESSEED